MPPIHNKEIFFNNLVDFAEVLERHNVHWWLDCGTALGLHRDGEFIDGDLDTDVGIFAEDFTDEIIEDLKEKGFEVGDTYGVDGKGREIAFTRNCVKTDLYFYYRKGDKRWMAMWLNKGVNGINDIIKMVYPAEQIEKIGTTTYRDQIFNIPQDIEGYLTTRYGDWRTPEPGFHWATSPRNIQPDFEI